MTSSNKDTQSAQTPCSGLVHAGAPDGAGVPLPPDRKPPRQGTCPHGLSDQAVCVRCDYVVEVRGGPGRARAFQTDFCLPAIQGLRPSDALRVSVALDAAIAFGVLEHLAGNPSLQNRADLEETYWHNIARLKRGVP